VVVSKYRRFAAAANALEGGCRWAPQVESLNQGCFTPYFIKRPRLTTVCSILNRNDGAESVNSCLSMKIFPNISRR